MPATNEEESPDPLDEAFDEYYTSYYKMEQGSKTQHRLIILLKKHILD